jgi:hypothetical protein
VEHFWLEGQPQRINDSAIHSICQALVGSAQQWLERTRDVTEECFGVVVVQRAKLLEAAAALPADPLGTEDRVLGDTVEVLTVATVPTDIRQGVSNIR